ncbi:hypothetical protein LBMAG27_09160 [Bacteroidota bacterium]|nr:hypothetical protein LBMAG27_09160 [Bacteroidota bacterium]
MELKYGVLAGIACVVWRAFEFYMGWPDSELGQYSSYIGILMMATGAYLCVVETRKINQGIMTFGKAFYSAIVVCFIISIMMGAHAYVFNSTVDPQRKERMAQQFHNEMVKEKKSDIEIKQVEENARTYFSPMGQVTAESGGTMIAGLFVSLIIAVFTRSKKNASRPI